MNDRSSGDLRTTQVMSENAAGPGRPQLPSGEPDLFARQDIRYIVDPDGNRRASRAVILAIHTDTIL